MIRVTVFVIGVVALLTSVVGAAASLSVGTDRLGAGDAAVVTCGSTASAVVTYTQSAGKVTHASVSGLPGTCNSGALRITLTTSAGAAVGSGSALVASGAASTIAISPQPDAAVVHQARILIEGP